MCSLLGYSRQAHYDHQKHHIRQKYEEEIILQQVQRHRSVQGKVGARKLLLMMKDFALGHNIELGRDRFFALLREHGMLVRKRRRQARTTMSHHMFHKYKNLVMGLVPCGPNQLWVSDITYICIANGFVYLSLVTDAYSRKIIGYCLSTTLEASGSVKALEMALEGVTINLSLIHHSDRGFQYCCNEYVQLLLGKEIKISMTEHGDPLENAIAERVNGVLKMELLTEIYQDFDSAKTAVDAAISIYNSVRLHSSCDMLTPDVAHQQYGQLKRHWKSYYKKKEVSNQVPD